MVDCALAKGSGGQRQRIQRVFIFALATNLMLTLLKLGVGVSSGSLAVLADAMHGATDSFSSLMGLLMNHLADPRPDRDHPYGHAKYQGLGAMAIAGFIFVAAVETLQVAVGRISRGFTPLALTPQQLLVLLLALGFNLLLAAYEFREGRLLRSPLLKADAEHSLSDMWTTALILLGLFGAWMFRINWLDVVLAVPVALMLVHACWRVLKANLGWLVDRIAIPPEAVHEVAMAVPGVLNCHDIASRGRLGLQVFIDMHLVVDVNDLPSAHRITELVEERLSDRFGPVRCTIHLEPRSYAADMITFKGVHG